MKTYKFKVHHDQGVFRMSTTATGPVSAANQICEAEGCPISALELIIESKK